MVVGDAVDVIVSDVADIVVSIGVSVVKQTDAVLYLYNFQKH